MKNPDFKPLQKTQEQLAHFYANLVVSLNLHLTDLPGMPLPSTRELLWSGWSSEWITTERYLLENFPYILNAEYEEQMSIIEEFVDCVFGCFLSPGIVFICDWPAKVMLDDEIAYIRPTVRLFNSTMVIQCSAFTEDNCRYLRALYHQRKRYRRLRSSSDIARK